jgi:hypothetical protein
VGAALKQADRIMIYKLEEIEQGELMAWRGGPGLCAREIVLY